MNDGGQPQPDSVMDFKFPKEKEEIHDIVAQSSHTVVMY